jgi:outer membrane protein assembly factor BamE
MMYLAACCGAGMMRYDEPMKAIIAEFPWARPAPRRAAVRALGRRAWRLALLGLGALLCACVYRMPILQGNYLDPDVIAQVKPGMTHSQVRYLLGTPMVPDAFDSSRWDYDFYFKTRRLQTPQRGHVVVHFEKNLVASVASDVTTAPFAPVSARGAHAPQPL